jgi:hypothetical protein
MARTRREQLLILGVASAVGIFVLDRYVLTPFTTAREAIRTQQEITQARLAEVNTLFKREQQMRRAWAGMTVAGIEASPAEAERKMLHALQAWAQQSGVANVSLRSERVNQPHGYVKVNVHVTGSAAGRRWRSCCGRSRARRCRSASRTSSSRRRRSASTTCSCR